MPNMKLSSNLASRSTCTMLAGLVLGLGACSQSDFGGRPASDSWGSYDDGGSRPGDEARSANPDITCDTNKDCGKGEICNEGICQMARCDEVYTSKPPLRPGTRFYHDRELLVANGSKKVAGFATKVDSIKHDKSWTANGGVADLASGNFLDRSEDSTVVIHSGVRAVSLADSPDISAKTEFVPVAVAAGDTNGDGRDEALVLGQFGKVAVCDMKAKKCHSFSINGDGIDITAGDIDGDGYDETVMLLGQGSKKLLYAWNHDREKTGQEDFHTSVEPHMARIDAGDFNGDGIAEVAGMAHEYNLGLYPALLYVWTGMGGFSEAHQVEINKKSIDIAAGDVDMDQRDELMVLHDDDRVQVMRPSKKTIALVNAGLHSVSGLSGSRTIALGDFDGDSPQAELMSETGELVLGPIAPLIAVHYPPYDAERSDGPSIIWVGNSESTSETWEDSVTMSWNASVGFSLAILSGNARVDEAVTNSTSVSKSYTIGTRILGIPSPDVRGYDEGLMMLTCACYHVYRYELRDPKKSLGLPSEREPFVTVLPVGGTVSAWSSKRYNQMAEAIGNLPLMEVPYTVGDPHSYPSGPQRADGSPIPVDDMVFPEVPSLLVGDASRVGFNLGVGSGEANTVATNRSWEISGSLDLGPFSLSGGYGEGRGSSYTLALGQDVDVGGWVPAVPDNPNTPEDEYLAYAFHFSPYLYLEHYKNADGEDASYYVISFAVGEREE